MEGLPKHDDNQFGLEEADEVALMKASYEHSLERQRQKTIMQTLHPASTGTYTSHPHAKPIETSRLSALMSPSPVVSAPVTDVVAPLNMQLQNSLVSNRMMVKACVKTTLFRRVKFFIKDMHGLYDLRDGTVCALIIANCNVTAAEVDEYWWADMRKLIVATHTDRRNNVIKNIRLRFNGTS